jgi:apolipoprotein N-acyltransferase
VVMRYGPLRQIWIRTTGHCGEFGSAPGATVTDLVIRYGPLHGMKQCSKNLYRFLRCGFGYVLWAITQYLVMRYGPCTGFGYELWAVAQDLLMHYGP